tara:strand:+ start:318 stop:695 length:378 start_codon:yes stop_codon:yes gene_type:complete
MLRQAARDFCAVYSADGAQCWLTEDIANAQNVLLRDCIVQLNTARNICHLNGFAIVYTVIESHVRSARGDPAARHGLGDDVSEDVLSVSSNGKSEQQLRVAHTAGHGVRRGSVKANELQRFGRKR